MDVNLRDKRALLEDALEFFRGNILTLLQLENILSTVNYLNGSIRQYRSNISRKKPAIFQNLISLFLILKVALKYCWTAEANFSPGIWPVCYVVIHVRNIC